MLVDNRSWSYIEDNVHVFQIQFGSRKHECRGGLRPNRLRTIIDEIIIHPNTRYSERFLHL